MAIEAWQVPLWDAIKRYVVACGGDPDKHVYGNTTRQKAVAEVCKVVNTAVSPEAVGLLRAVLAGEDILTDRKWKRAAERLTDDT